MDTRDKHSEKNVRSRRKSKLFRVIGIIAIGLCALFALEVIGILLDFGQNAVWIIGISWAILFGLSIAASKLITKAAKRSEVKWREKFERLQQSRDSYRAIADSLPYPLALVCEDGRIAYYNDVFGKIIDEAGIEAEKFDFLNLIQAEDRGLFRLGFLNCARNGSPSESIELRLIIDPEKPYEAIIRQFEQEINGTTCCEVQIRDISTAIDLAGLNNGTSSMVQEHLFQEAISQSPIGILILNTDGRVESVNSAALKLFRVSEDEIIGKNIADSSLAFFSQFDFSAVLDGKKTLQKIKEVWIDGETSESILLLYSIIPLNDTEANTSRLAFMFQDVTENIRAYHKFVYRQSQTDILFENTSDGVIISDTSGIIVRANKSAADITKYDIDELRGMSINELFTLEEREISLRQFAWIKQGRPVRFDSKLLSARGKIVDVDISGRKITIGDEDFILDIIHDISERKRFLARFAQTKKIESIGEMAGGIALDFNDILEAITGAAELARESVEMDGDADSYLGVILSSAHRGANLARRLMTYARQSIIEAELLDINEIVLDVKNYLDHSLKKNYSVAVNPAPDIGPISGDRSSVEQAIINLALNARDAMPDGGEITILTRQFEATETSVRDYAGLTPGHYIELAVQDTGHGIAPEVLPSVLDPFFTTKEDAEGLGLPMVHSTAKSHGGSVDIKSVLDGGTEVYMYFPAAELQQNLEERASLEKSPRTDTKIMVVDDEDVIQTVVEGILMQLGYSVIRAQSGKEALEYLTDHNGEVDLILLDMIMPGLSGWDVFQRLKQFWPNIPVIVITGYAQEEHISSMLERGLEGFLEKPFKAAQLSEKIEDVLGET